MARRPARSTLLRIGAAALCLGGMGVAFATQASKLSTFDWRFAPGWLALGVMAFVALQMTVCQLWVMLVRHLGGELPTLRGYSIWSVSVLGRYVPTGALMVVGRLDMARRAGVPRRICMASILYETALAAGGALVVASAFVPVWVTVTLIMLMLISLHPRVLHPVADRVLARAGREPLPAVLSAREVLGFATAYIATYSLAGLGTLALALALHPVASEDVLRVVASFAVGFIASLIGFLSPGGLGAREVAQATVLAPALPFAVGLAVAVTVRLVQMSVELVLAGALPLVERRRAR
jgi:hypothetical protein